MEQKISKNFLFTPTVEEVNKKAYRYAKTHFTVLIVGATGSGKERVAQYIHDNSARHLRPYIDCNCATMKDDLFVSEFFGYEKGIYTGANESKAGLIEAAAGGTIFLDEFECLSMNNQGKLLRVLSDLSYHRLGGKELKVVNVRFILAMNESPEEMIKNGKLREDFYFRVKELRPLILPKFREYANEEKLSFLKFFNEKFSSNLNKEMLTFDNEVIDFILNFSFPGNIRELENLIKSLLVDDIKNVSLEIVQQYMSPVETKTGIICDNPWTLNINEVQKEVAKIAFDKSGGVWEKAAEQVGVNYRTLKEWLNYNERSSDKPIKHLTRK